MTPETLAWLSQKAPDFAALSTEDQEHFSDFLLLWSLFEGSELNKAGSVAEIRRYVGKLKRNGKLKELDADDYLHYLRGRYYVDGNFTRFYDDLHLDRSGQSPEVPETLKDSTVPKDRAVVGCLVIIFRLRNNLFHGEKWQYELVGDQENFFYANRFLKNLMSLKQRERISEAPDAMK